MSRLRAPSGRGFRILPTASLLFLSMAFVGVGAPPVPNAPVPKTQSATGQDAAADEPVKLSPFVVDGADDAGYAARSSLAGTRLKTPLADIGAQVSVFTPELMADLALTNPEEVFLYSTNVDSYLEWTPGGDIGENRGTFFIDRNNVSRGLGQLTNMREFFPTNFQTDGYNTGRVTIASGANSVLFGLGSPAGVSDISLNRAIFRPSYNVSARVDNFDGYRMAVDINQPILKDRLAIRVAGLNNNNHTFRPESPDRNKRLYATTTIQPFKNTTLRWSGEWIQRNASRAPMILPRDWISPWWDGGKRGFDNRGITPVTATNIVNSRMSSQGFGSEVVRNNKLLVYRYGASALSGAFIDETNTVATNNAGLGTSVLLDQAPDWSLNRRDIFDPDANLFGSAYEVQQTGHIQNVFVEQRLLDNLFVEFGFADEKFRERWGSGVNGSSLRVQADANLYLSDGVTPNPDFGKTYVEGTGFGQRKHIDSDNLRLTVAYAPDFTKKSGWMRWLGRYQLAGLYEIWNFTNAEQTHQMATPDNASFLSSNAQRNNGRSGERNLQARYYYGPGSTSRTSSFPGGNLNIPEPVVHRLPNGEDVSYYMWTGEGAWGAPGGNKQETVSRALNGQGYLLKDRLLFFYGWREDRIRRIDSFSPESQVRKPFRQVNGTLAPNTGLYPFLEESTFPADWSFHDRGTSISWGTVVRPLSWLQFHFSDSENYAIQTDTWFNPYGERIEGSFGNGRDYGFSVRVMDDKWTLRVNAFENVQLNSRPDNIVSAARRIATNIEGRILEVAPQTPKQGIDMERYRAANYQLTNTIEAEGHDVELVGNPTKNWRLFLSAGRQRTQVQIDDVWWRWVEERLPVWRTVGRGWDVETIGANNPQTIHQAYNEWVTTSRDPLMAADGKFSDNQREWRANLMVTHIFGEGKLKGFSIGGGGRYRSAPYVGYGLKALDSGATVLDLTKPYKGRDEFYIDALFKYTLRKTPLLGDKVATKIQLNIRNLLDESDYLVSQAKADGSPKIYRYQSPRQIILSIDFGL